MTCYILTIQGASSHQVLQVPAKTQEGKGFSHHAPLSEVFTTYAAEIELPVCVCVSVCLCVLTGGEVYCCVYLYNVSYVVAHARRYIPFSQLCVLCCVCY